MLLFILYLVVIFCIYLLFNHAISDIYQYKYMKGLTKLFRDTDTRQLFIYLRPYLETYISLIRKDSNNYAINTDMYREYLKAIQRIKNSQDTK